jgi:hypothetical protein
MTREGGDFLSHLDAQTPDKHNDTRGESALYIFGVRINRYKEQLYTEYNYYHSEGLTCAIF